MGGDGRTGSRRGRGNFGWYVKAKKKLNKNKKSHQIKTNKKEASGIFNSTKGK